MASVLAIAEPALIGAGVIALPIGVNALLSHIKVRKLLPVIRKAFVVIDPLLNEHLSGYSGSDVRFAIELVTGVLSDGHLSREEVELAVSEIEKRYRPSAGAGKTSEGLKLQLGEDSREVKLLENVADLVHHPVLKGASLMEAVDFIREQIS